jgi:hypothetical protein
MGRRFYKGRKKWNGAIRKRHRAVFKNKKRDRLISQCLTQRNSGYSAIDMRHDHILVKFERMLSIQFGRKKEKQNVFQRDGSTHFFVKNAKGWLTATDPRKPNEFGNIR